MATASNSRRRRWPKSDDSRRPASMTQPFRQIAEPVPGHRIASSIPDAPPPAEQPQVTGEQLIEAINDGTLAKALAKAGDRAPEVATRAFAQLSDMDIKNRVSRDSIVEVLEQLPRPEYWYMGGRDGPEGVEMPEGGFPEGLPFRLSRLVDVPEDYRDWVQDKTERVTLRMAQDPLFDKLREHGTPAQSWHKTSQKDREAIMARTMDLLLEEYEIPRDKITLSFFNEPRRADGGMLYGSCSENLQTGEIEVALNTNRDGPFHTLNQGWDTVTHELTHVLQSHLSRTWQDLPEGDPRKEAGRLFAIIPRNSSAVAAAMGHRAYEAQVIERDARDAGADGVGWLRHYGRMSPEKLADRLREAGGEKPLGGWAAEGAAPVEKAPPKPRYNDRMGEEADGATVDVTVSTGAPTPTGRGDALPMAASFGPRH